MKTITEKLMDKSITAKLYDPFGDSLDVKGLEQYIRRDFRKNHGGGHWVKALYNTLWSGTNWAFSGHKKSKNPGFASAQGKDLVFVLHGLSIPFLGEHNGKFKKLKDMGNNEKTHIVALNYDDRKEFNGYVSDVSEEIKRIADSSGCNSVYVIGHSTGGDVTRALNHKEIGINGIVTAAPTTNGKVPNQFDNLLFGSKTNYHNPKKPEHSRAILEHLQRPLDVPGITICYLNDMFVPMYASVDRKDQNLIVGGMGHLAGTGGYRPGNIVYLEALEVVKLRNEISSPKSF